MSYLDEKLTYNEIINKLYRLGNGDDMNDPQTLVYDLRFLTRQAENLLKEKTL